MIISRDSSLFEQGRGDPEEQQRTQAQAHPDWPNARKGAAELVAEMDAARARARAHDDKKRTP